jgi:hypothetical protein
MKIKALQESLWNNGYVVLDLPLRCILYDIQDVIRRHFPGDAEYYSRLSRETWHELILSAQNEINSLGILKNLVGSAREIVSNILDESQIAWVNVIKLRAVRPVSLTSCPDHVPFHRETLYARTNQVRYQYNLWCPVSANSIAAGLSYYPGSHLIRDEVLSIGVDNSHYAKVEQYSPGHAIGYPYMPKIIRNLEEICKVRPEQIKVPVGSCLLFSAMLIHGNGINRTNEIRFSVDTGCIPESRLVSNSNLYAAGNRPHYHVFQ